nr:MAG TPA: hypothetical protein [Caudoviricetes sp.]
MPFVGLFSISFFLYLSILNPLYIMIFNSFFIQKKNLSVKR